MRPRLILPVIVVAAALAGFAAFALAAGKALRLSPSSVVRGHVVTVSGSVDHGCSVRDSVTLISRAFVHTHDFAGVAAVFAPVRANGTFRAVTRIPASRRPGRYTVTARCGGGNLGIVRYLTVLR